MDSETQATYALNGKVMLASTIFLFLIILVIIFLHTYCHSCFRRRRRSHGHRHRILTNNSPAAFKEDGLHPSVINFLPTFTCSSDTHRPHHDCAVCLSEFADGEEGRILPNCNHAFHSHCIDAWFHSHSNCPLCRTPVHQRTAPVQPPPTASSSIEPGPVGFSSFPAPIGCPRKSMELVGIIVEVEDMRQRDSDPGHTLRISRVQRVG